MQFSPPLKPATLIQRYKRFLADVITPEGETLTLHCPNTGAMTGCATPATRSGIPHQKILNANMRTPGINANPARGVYLRQHAARKYADQRGDPRRKPARTDRL